MRKFIVTIKKEGIFKNIKCTEKNIDFKISEARFYGYKAFEIFECF